MFHLKHWSSNGRKGELSENYKIDKIVAPQRVCQMVLNISELINLMEGRY